jgi:molecular chaperone GrpE
VTPEQDMKQAQSPAVEETAGEQPVSEEQGLAPEAPAPEEGVAQDAVPEEPDYKDKWLRAAADLENVRKRARRDVAAAEARGIAKLARELLPALDNFERALAAAEAEEADEEHHLTHGIRLVQQELSAALTRVGIEAFSPQGEAFDPNEHEAMAQQPVEGTEPGTVVEVYQSGYRINGAVLRPARVVVAA